ncbi:MAG: tyrosine-type recombinase/integrase [Bacillota bacterium]
MSERKNEAYWVAKNNRWQIKVQSEGVRKTFNSSTPGKKGKIETEKKADKWLDGQLQDSGKRFSIYWEEFLASKKGIIDDKYLSNLKGYGELYLLPILKLKKISNITPLDWQTCVDTVYKKGLSAKTCKNVRGAITTFCRYMRKRNISIADASDISIPENAPIKEKVILQPQNIRTLFTKDTVMIRGKEEPCFFIYSWRFILLLGLRSSELCHLEKKDLSNNLLKIRGTKTKAARRRAILSQNMMMVLKQQQAMLKSKGIISPYLFPDEYGEKLTASHLYKKWRTYREQHNIESNLKELRHTLISISKADMPEELLKLVVGHTKNTDTFGIYGHEVEGELERAADIFDSIINEIMK